MSTPLEKQPVVMAGVREAIRLAGFHPDSRPGKSLYEWGVGYVRETGRVPSPQACSERAERIRIEPEPVDFAPDTIERQIAEAREQGDFHTASKLQTEVDRARTAPGPLVFTGEETAAIAAARERAEAVEGTDFEANRQRREAWEEASAIQRRAEARMAGAVHAAPEPHPTIQPTYQPFNDEQLALLEGTAPIAERIAEAQKTRQWVVASMLQDQQAKGDAGAVAVTT